MQIRAQGPFLFRRSRTSLSGPDKTDSYCKTFIDYRGSLVNRRSLRRVNPMMRAETTMAAATVKTRNPAEKTRKTRKRRVTSSLCYVYGVLVDLDNDMYGCLTW